MAYNDPGLSYLLAQIDVALASVRMARIAYSCGQMERGAEKQQEATEACRRIRIEIARLDAAAQAVAFEAFEALQRELAELRKSASATNGR